MVVVKTTIEISHEFWAMPMGSEEEQDFKSKQWVSLDEHNTNFENFCEELGFIIINHSCSKKAEKRINELIAKYKEFFSSPPEVIKKRKVK